MQLQLTLEQPGFELQGSTYMGIFFNSKYYTTTWSTVGSADVEYDTEEPWIWRAR